MLVSARFPGFVFSVTAKWYHSIGNVPVSQRSLRSFGLVVFSGLQNVCHAIASFCGGCVTNSATLKKASRLSFAGVLGNMVEG